MKVLIVSKTHMHHGQCCVGGLTIEGENIRLVMEDGHYPPENTDLTPGLIYDIEFTAKQNTELPHIEDVTVHSYKLSEALEGPMLDFIEELGVPVWEGDPEEVLFDGKLQWTDKGTGYINEEDIPEQSVGFWVFDKNLLHYVFEARDGKKDRYRYKGENGWHSFPYIGYDEPVKVIPAGTLIRVSLARWWDKKGATEPRCSLQLSGWYDL